MNEPFFFVIVMVNYEFELEFISNSPEQSKGMTFPILKEKTFSVSSPSPNLDAIAEPFTLDIPS